MSARPPRIALVTCAALPEPDADADVLASAVRAAGGEPAWVAWDDPAARLEGFDLAVVRSTWNYPEHVEAFERWLVRAASVTRLENPLEVLQKNLHKGYLLGLEAAGVPVVPTWLVRREDGPSAFAAAVDAAVAQGAGRLVVKPAVGCGSSGARTFFADDGAEARAHVARLAATHDVIVQPFVDGVETDGERSVVCVDGAPSHVVVKAPRFEGGVERTSPPRAPEPFEAELARRVLACAGGPTLYGRVDLFPDGAGAWANRRAVVSELEVLEPSLFLRDAPEALARFARAIVGRAGGPAAHPGATH